MQVSGAVAPIQYTAPDGTAVDVTDATPLPVSGGGGGGGGATEVTAQQQAELLLRILQMLNAPLGYDKSQARQRGTVVVESGTVTTVATVTTVTAVSSLTNLAGIGGYNASMQVFDTNRAAWAQCVRARIT